MALVIQSNRSIRSSNAPDLQTRQRSDRKFATAEDEATGLPREKILVNCASHRPAISNRSLVQRANLKPGNSRLE